jgi:quercetin dioxygenase-like cupin family protein
MSNTTSEQTISMLPAGQGRSYLLLGTELVTFKASASQTGGAFMTVEATIPPGSGPPLHKHHPQELFYIVEGEFEFPTLRDGQVQTIRAIAGCVVHIPSWVPHTYQNVGQTPGRLLATLTPPTMEGYFQELGEPVPDPSNPPRPAGPPDWERIEALRQKYHIEYIHPTS